jgi:hypothetical protein
LLTLTVEFCAWSGEPVGPPPHPIKGQAPRMTIITSRTTAMVRAEYRSAKVRRGCVMLAGIPKVDVPICQSLLLKRSGGVLLNLHPFSDPA